MRKSTRIAATVASAGLIAAAMAAPASAARPDWSKSTGKSIVEIASTNDSFNVLTTALVASGAVALFDGTDYTVFAPTDAAFEDAFGAGESVLIDMLVENDGALAKSLVPVLAYHVTEGVRNSKSVTSAKKVTMLSGGTITARGGFVDAANSDADFVVGSDGKPMIDIRATDGIIHVIDAVLLP
jgi:uncharacterized surface protein with fasciclin (FAS1) repeats